MELLSLLERLLMSLKANYLATTKFRKQGSIGNEGGQPDCTHTPRVQNYAAKHRPSTRQNICESLRVISFKHSSVLPDDGSHKIRNITE